MILGVLGGIGSGKSTVTRLLVELGAEALDADALAHDVLEEEDVKNTLRSWWGDEVIAPSGEADRAAIATRVFSSAEERERLESLIHPRVRDEIRQRVEAFRGRSEGATVPKLLVLDVPLLASSPLRDLCDELVFIQAEPAQRSERTAERGWSETELERREAAQSSMEEKERLATRRLDNRDGLPQLRQRVAELYESLLGVQSQGTK